MDFRQSFLYGCVASTEKPPFFFLALQLSCGISSGGEVKKTMVIFFLNQNCKYYLKIH